MNRLQILALIFLPLPVFAQSADSAQTSRPLTLSGYVEVYYAHDLSASRLTNERPGFLYNFRRNREVTVNLAFLKAAYASEQVRANLALQVGTYPQYNYAAEPEVLRTILEANAGVRLSHNRDLWLDAGVFSSHIGFESAIGKDNWTLTRSIVAENSPYFLTGAKVTYNTLNGKWALLGSIVNGWQRIQRPEGFGSPAISTQVQFRPSSFLTLNWSTFFGSNQPDSLRQTRQYHNVYALIQQGKVGVILGLDVGADRKPIVNGQRVGQGHDLWYTPVTIVRYTITDRLRLAGRAEYYHDPNSVIITTGTSNGFQTWGFSVNVDYSILPQALFRIESRTFQSKDAIFQRDSGFQRTNTAITGSFSVSF